MPSPEHRAVGYPRGGKNRGESMLVFCNATAELNAVVADLSPIGPPPDPKVDLLKSRH